MRDAVTVVHELVARIDPLDALESEHITDTLQWLESTDDVFRRAKPATPARHLVSYAVIVDRRSHDILLIDHVNAGLFLPPGGHVEPGEHPAATARRESLEELGVDPFADGRLDPAFLTVTQTIGRDAGHTDVSLWFIGDGSRTMALTLDETEFRGARWWSLDEIAAADATTFDPHLRRFIRKAFPLR